MISSGKWDMQGPYNDSLVLHRSRDMVVLMFSPCFSPIGLWSWRSTAYNMVYSLKKTFFAHNFRDGLTQVLKQTHMRLPRHAGAQATASTLPTRRHDQRPIWAAMATNHNGDQGSGRGLLHPAGAHKLQCCFSSEMSCCTVLPHHRISIFFRKFLLKELGIASRISTGHASVRTSE